MQITASHAVDLGTDGLHRGQHPAGQPPGGGSEDEPGKRHEHEQRLAQRAIGLLDVTEIASNVQGEHALRGVDVA